MITWMQNNNKYLVITIWIATIAFIGAGFVGWGSVNFGSSASSVAKVGDIPISVNKYSFTYNNLYAQKVKEFNGKFDKKKAQELGLGKAVLSSLVNEALLLNFAKENGVTTTEKELGLEIASYNLFKDKNGAFNKSIYDNFLRSRGMKAKDFEAIIKDEIIARKVSKLINVKPLDLEKKSMELTFNIADKIKYNVIKRSDINVTVNDKELKDYWEKNKLNYMTKTEYKLDLLWTEAKDLNISDKELEDFYKANSFNYSSKDGKIKEFKEAKDLVLNDVKLSKIKKQAAIERSRFKKGKLTATESVMIQEGDNKLTKEIWNLVASAKSGDFLKPKAVKDRYVTVKVAEVIKPKVMSFDEAKPLMEKEYKAQKQKKELEKIAKEQLNKSDEFKIEPKDYITLSKFQVLPELTPQDSMLVNGAIFASDKGVDSVKVSDGIVVYKIEEQKILDSNTTSATLDGEINTIKSAELSRNLIKELSSKYSTEVYMKDIK